VSIHGKIAGMIKLNAKQLRSRQSSAISRQTIKKNDIYIILDNVLDTYNIGSIFRLADEVGAKAVFFVVKCVKIIAYAIYLGL